MTRVAGVLGLIVLLCGCASGRHPEFGAEITALNAPLIGGMAQIRDKALDPPDLDRLFVAGLAHMSAIDPDLHADVVNDEVVLTLAELTVAHLPRPAPQDIGAWAETTETLIAAARKVSKAMAESNSEALLKAFYDGAMPLLDPYSRYYSHLEARRNQNVRNGFIGLGLELQPTPKGALVRVTLKNGPADIAGVQVGDIITHADGKSLASVSLPVILRRLDGPRDSAVRLRVLRGEARHEITTRRALIIPETVEAETRDGVLQLVVRSFNQRTAADIAEKVAAAGALRGIILDLRGDPGGLLDQGVAVADLFLDKGVIATLRGRHPGAMQFYAATPGDIAAGAPIVMLVDGRSASAAEILGAALQDNGRAIAVGTASVGKGTVQTIIPLANGGEFALTWSRVFTPSGSVLSGRGVLPDVCTEGTAGTQAAELIAALVQAGPRPHQPVELVRTVCRPEPHGRDSIDMEVAQRLVTDAKVRAALHLPEASQLATTH